ncbi:MAG: transcription antitermination factor NusB [Bacteroidales bacterium]|nr:transcription antitermination factor NusB [Bacteroidales bacterium]MBQ7873491.1 transcription antitermination factor NusB [Clostridia bacterium]
MTRKEQREATFELLFEREFRREEAPDEIFYRSTEHRDIDPIKETYIKNTYFGVIEHEEEIDALITNASNGWKVSRLSNASRSAIRLCAYEMLYCEDIPSNVSINEALELVKKFDEPKSRAFTNGVLNSIKNAIENKND